jgi:hypothetical protein
VTVFATLDYGPGSVDFHGGGGGVTSGLVLATVDGIGQAPIRAPVDDMPQADGGIVHQFFYGPRHLTVEGFVLPFAYDSSHAATLWAAMDSLEAALGQILRADGTFAWTPPPMSCSRTARVRCCWRSPVTYRSHPALRRGDSCSPTSAPARSWLTSPGLS